ncbi:uncharacterized protein IL334_003210 [Kwoniella shivajii]|uniref:Amidase domain-containing protein n=1 Tax=Kwoniella shivajii TaxID=564305 RepID=A0ABZ1CY31_9TREE|nr:hypothetical protein IL334_003210 [Kwoniella shivajii]
MFIYSSILPCYLLFATASPLTAIRELIFQSPLDLSEPSLRLQSVSGISITQSEKELFYQLDNVHYFTPYSFPAHTVSATGFPDLDDAFHPLVILPISKPKEGIFTIQHMEPLIESYLSEDDVLSKSFFETVILHPDSDSDDFNLEMTVIGYLMREMNTKRIILDERLSINVAAPGPALPGIPIHTISAKSLKEGIAGPCVVQYGEDRNFDLYPVSRLYSDYYKTFVSGIYPLNDGQGTYKTLNKIDEHGNKLIPVPSRHYAKGSKKPLAGERAAIKDVYYVKGVPTSAGSRVFAAWRGDVYTTASSVQKLDENGAVIVGKVKTAGPFSPRGDHYQSCGTSSSGPSCALAAYDWLDFTVASDTGGSIRGPAAVVGLYGNKPTQGIIPLDGVVPLFKFTDTAGIFTRSPSKLKKILETWYGDSPVNRRHNHLPKTLLVPSDDFPTMRKDIKFMVMDFLQAVGSTFGMKVEMINQTAIHPHDGNSHGSDDMMTIGDFDVAAEMWQWQTLASQVVEAYEHVNGGRFPPVGSEMSTNMRRARNTTWGDDEFNRMTRKLEFTAKSFNDIIGRDEETCSKTIYAEPMALNQMPEYREQKLNDMTERLSPRINPLYPSTPSSISGAPHYIVPIGQVPFKSLVSDQWEYQTVSMSLMAYPGCDFMLLDLIDKLEKAGVITEVKTGRTTFDVVSE